MNGPVAAQRRNSVAVGVSPPSLAITFPVLAAQRRHLSPLRG